MAVRPRPVAPNALVVELVDTPVLEAGAEMRESSSLSLGTKLWRRGRVAEGTSLLTKQTERFREFESHRLRQIRSNKY